MARDLSETVRDALGNVVREALKNAGDVSPSKKKSGPLSGVKGLAAGMGLAAAAPLAKKGVDAMRANGGIPGPSKMAGRAASKAGDKVSDTLKDTVSSKVDEAGGAGGLVKDAASGLLPWGGGGGDSGGGKGGVAGVGKGRRMPVQQAVDVGVPLETAYNQWTQFEDWPTFMHRVTNVSQDDDCNVKFSTKIWTRKREFTAKIETQRPDERIKWRVSQGITHTGVVTFHELAPRLTRIELSLDVDPGSLIEKAARGMRHVKRAARADLHRFKAFIEMAEHETGAWRGRIEDGDLVEEHDPSYDEEREYSDIEDFIVDSEDDEEDEETDDEQTDDEQTDDEQPEDEGGSGNGGDSERRERFKAQAERTGAGERAKSRPRAKRAESSDKESSGPSKSRAKRRPRSSSSGSGSSGGRSRGSGSGSKGSQGRRKSTSSN
jgi:uncharacterized membrane protein